jgi:translation elongation factor P/translation initiation factor 5A
MLEIKRENLQYIYQDNERKGAIMDIHTFEAVMGVL